MSEKVKLQWEKPPVGRRKGGSSRIDAEVRELKKRPGTWAKVRSNAPAGNYITYKKRGVMTRVSSVGNNHYDIWCVWFGVPGEPAEVKAMDLEPNVKISHPAKERMVVVRDVIPAEEDKVIVEYADGGKNRRLKVDANFLVTAHGVV